jgi:hypothetical protein
MRKESAECSRVITESRPNILGTCAQGVHYGMFPGEDATSTVWTAVRPHNWRPTAAREHLVEFDARTGAAFEGCGEGAPRAARGVHVQKPCQFNSIRCT